MGMQTTRGMKWAAECTGRPIERKEAEGAEEAIGTLKGRKAPGADGVMAVLVKHARRGRELSNN